MRCPGSAPSRRSGSSTTGRNTVRSSPWTSWTRSQGSGRPGSSSCGSWSTCDQGGRSEGRTSSPARFAQDSPPRSSCPSTDPVSRSRRAALALAGPLLRGSTPPRRARACARARRGVVGDGAARRARRERARAAPRRRRARPGRGHRSRPGRPLRAPSAGSRPELRRARRRRAGPSRAAARPGAAAGSDPAGRRHDRAAAPCGGGGRLRRGRLPSAAGSPRRARGRLLPRARPAGRCAGPRRPAPRTARGLDRARGSTGNAGRWSRASSWARTIG